MHDVVPAEQRVVERERFDVEDIGGEREFIRQCYPGYDFDAIQRPAIASGR